MLCDRCQHNEATVHIVQVVVGHEKTSLNLCGKCIAEDSSLQHPDGIIDLSQVMGELTGTTPDAGAPPAPPEADVEQETVVCSGCGLDSEQFRKTGRLGCPDCYQAFSSVLDGALPTMHRGTQHIGRGACAGGRPSGMQRLLSELSSLEEELTQAVAAEAYERAAQLRDRIKCLSSSGQEGQRS